MPFRAPLRSVVAMTITKPAPAPTPAPPRTNLWRAAGGGRYAFALVVDALGAGLLRPFLLLYAITIERISVGVAGLALSAGLFVGLAVLPAAGRWLDRGARRGPVLATLVVRIAGLVALLTLPGITGFCTAALLLGVGTQVWPMANAAVITSLSPAHQRDAALAATRSLRNAGLGAGALIATLAVADGDQVMRQLALLTAVGCVAAAVSVATMSVPSAPVAERRQGDCDALSGLTRLMVANLPFALCFDVLEVALPAVLVTRLHASPAWSSGIFVGNTALVIATQVTVVRRLNRCPRRTVFAASGGLLSLSYLGFWLASMTGASAALLIALISIVYSAGEIVYAGVGTALVVAAVPQHVLGRALARWQLSAGIGRAAAPLTLTGLLALSPSALWLLLAATTAVGAVVVQRDSVNSMSLDR